MKGFIATILAALLLGSCATTMLEVEESGERRVITLRNTDAIAIAKCVHFELASTNPHQGVGRGIGDRVELVENGRDAARVWRPSRGQLLPPL